MNIGIIPENKEIKDVLTNLRNKRYYDKKLDYFNVETNNIMVGDHYISGKLVRDSPLRLVEPELSFEERLKLVEQKLGL